MYLVDLVKRLTKKNNIPTLIYLVLNVFVITGIVMLMFNEFQMPFWEAFLIAMGAYIVSLLLALSPFGEWILRIQTGCKKIKRVELINYIEPIFREVYEKAKKLDPSIPDDVQIFVCTDKTPNAFATGRKTICITEGLLRVPEEQIKATLGHEFGHLAHKDTDLLLLVAVGNFIVTTFILIIRFAIDLLYFVSNIMARSDRGYATVSFMYRAMIAAFVAGLTWIWTKIGVILVMKSSRDNEYGADEFSFNLGYGNELCKLLDTFKNSHAKGLFANLASSHPDKDDRIARLQELGATYRANYVK